MLMPLESGMKMKPEDLSEAARLIAEDMEAENHGIIYPPQHGYKNGPPDFSDKVVILKSSHFARWIGPCLERVKAGQDIRIRKGNSEYSVKLISVDKVYPKYRGGPGNRNWMPPHRSVLPDSLRGDNE